MKTKTQKLIAAIFLSCCAATMAAAIILFGVYLSADNDALRTPSYVFLIVSSVLGLIGAILRPNKKTN
jgi:hypothetical protein